MARGGGGRHRCRRLRVPAAAAGSRLRGAADEPPLPGAPGARGVPGTFSGRRGEAVPARGAGAEPARGSPGPAGSGPGPAAEPPAERGRRQPLPARVFWGFYFKLISLYTYASGCPCQYYAPSLFFYLQSKSVY